MNKIFENVQNVFKENFEAHKKNAQQIDLAFIGICQNFNVFAYTKRNLLFMNDEGSFEVYLKNDKPENVVFDIAVYVKEENLPEEELNFNFKDFIQWLYNRNTLVDEINMTNLEVIDYLIGTLQRRKLFLPNAHVDITGKLCDVTFEPLKSYGEREKFIVKTFDYKDKPHCIINGKTQYKFSLSDKMPANIDEMDITPETPSNDDIIELKNQVMTMLSSKSDDGDGHELYYELLLMYRGYNPDI